MQPQRLGDKEVLSHHNILINILNSHGLMLGEVRSQYLLANGRVRKPLNFLNWSIVGALQ